MSAIKSSASARPKRPLGTAALAAVVLLVLPLVYLLTRDWGHVLNQDIRASIPALAESAQTGEVRERLQSMAANSVVLKVTVPGVDAQKLRAAIAAAADRQTVFDAPFFPGDTENMRALGEYIFQERDALFFPGWLQERWSRFQATGQPQDEFATWLAAQSVSELDDFLGRSEAAAYAELLPRDPLLLIPQARASLPAAAMSGSETAGVVAWLPASADAMSPRGQAAIAASVASVKQAIWQQWPEAEIESGGVYEIAQVTEVRTRHEVNLLNVIMLVVIVVLLVLMLRRVADLLLAFIVLSAAVLCAGAAGLLVFGEIHVLALGIASIVLGLAVDYTVHLIAHNSDRGLLHAWRCIRKPLLAGCLSSCVGLMFLWLAPLPAIQQVGLMVPVGLLAALASVRWVLPGIAPASQRPPLRTFITRGWLLRVSRWGWGFLVVVWCAALVVMLTRMRADDDIGSYQIPVGEVMERYQRLLKEVGGAMEEDVSVRWFSYAPTPEGLLQHVNELRAASVELVGPASLLGRAEGSEAWEVFEPQREAFGRAFLRKLDEDGFESDAFRGFVKRLYRLPGRVSDDAQAAAVRGLAEQLRGPMRMGLLTDGTDWIGTFGVRGEAAVPVSLKTTTHILDERVELGHVLGAARRVVMRSALWGFLAISGVLLVAFGWRKGLAVALLPVWAVTFGLAAVSLLGGGVSLLALIGAVLAYCLGLDYGAFAVSCRGEAPASIRVSALTTASAFAVLSFSGMKAVSDFGLVVSVGVLFAWIGAECLALPVRRTPRNMD